MKMNHVGHGGGSKRSSKYEFSSWWLTGWATPPPRSVTWTLKNGGWKMIPFKGRAVKLQEGMWSICILELYKHRGQTISTSHDFFTPKGSFLAGNPNLFQGNPGWWKIRIWPDTYTDIFYMQIIATDRSNFPDLGGRLTAENSCCFHFVGATKRAVCVIMSSFPCLSQLYKGCVDSRCSWDLILLMVQKSISEPPGMYKSL